MSDIGLLNVTPDPRASLDASSSVNTEEGKSQDLVNGSSEVYSDEIISFRILDFGSESEINGFRLQSIDSVQRRKHHLVLLLIMVIIMVIIMVLMIHLVIDLMMRIWRMTRVQFFRFF